MNRWLTLALVGVTFAVGALTLGTAAQLPGRVATHFDWSGRPNGWMDRDTYIAFALGFSVAIPWIVYAAMALLPGRFPRLSNLRHKRYWLEPSRREATLRSLGTFAAATALATAGFTASLHLSILEAHTRQPPQLDNATFLTALALFVVATIGIAVAYQRRFARPPDRALQS